METGFHSYCGRVCALIRWKPAREAARNELLAHLEDHAEALKARGVPPGEAEQRAVAAMGDPEDLGRQLDQTHPPPLFPGLPTLLLVLALVLLLIGGIRLTALRPAPLFYCGQSSTAPVELLQSGDILLVEALATGGGTVDAYTVTAGPAALVADGGGTTPPELRVCLTVRHWQPWLNTLDLPALSFTWKDEAGRTREVYLRAFSGPTSLSVTWLAVIPDPPVPWDRPITLLLEGSDSQLAFTIAPQEVTP